MFKPCLQPAKADAGQLHDNVAVFTHTYRLAITFFGNKTQLFQFMAAPKIAACLSEFITETVEHRVKQTVNESFPLTQFLLFYRSVVAVLFWLLVQIWVNSRSKGKKNSLFSEEWDFTGPSLQNQIYVRWWKPWLFYLCATFLSLSTHYSLLFHPGNEEVTQLNRNLKREQLVLHSLLNLFQSFNAEWLLITGWGCGGRPQSAASGDTPTLRCAADLLQLLLLWKPRRRRWLVSGLLLFIIPSLPFSSSPLRNWQTLHELW